MPLTRLHRSLSATAALLAATALWRATADHFASAHGSVLVHGLWFVAASLLCAHIGALVARARAAGEPFSAGWLVPTAALGAFLPVLGITILGLLLGR